MLIYANGKQMRVPVVLGQWEKRKLKVISRNDLCGVVLKVPVGTCRWMQMGSHPSGYEEASLTYTAHRRLAS